jgi:hypothetical protein
VLKSKTMPQQQALSPVTLAQRYADLRLTSVRSNQLFAISVLVAAILQIWAGFQLWMGYLPLIWAFPVTMGLIFWLSLFSGYSNRKNREEADLYAQLLAIFKDEPLPLPLADRVAVLAALTAATPPPLPALAQARLAQKLAYASPAELAALPRAPLHAWLRDLETPDDLRISLLLALGTLQDHAIRPLAQEIAQIAPTERLREAALECLKSLESAP